MNTEKLNEGCSTDVKILFGSNPGRVPHIYKDGVRAAVSELYAWGQAALSNDDATRRVAHEIGRDQRLWNEFYSPAFPSRAQDACGRHGSS